MNLTNQPDTAAHSPPKSYQGRGLTIIVFICVYQRISTRPSELYRQPMRLGERIDVYG